MKKQFKQFYIATIAVLLALPILKNSGTFLRPGKVMLAGLLVGVTLLQSACDQHKRDHSGNDFSIADHAGKWVMVNYWAEWCAPCIEEIPELNQLHKRYPEELVVLGVNFDKIGGEELSTLASRMHIRFGLIDPDPADILRLSRPAGLPTTYIFGRDGILAAKLVGPQTGESLLKYTDIKP